MRTGPDLLRRIRAGLTLFFVEAAVVLVVIAVAIAVAAIVLLIA